MIGRFTEKGLGYLTKVVEEHIVVLKKVTIGQNLNEEHDLIEIEPGTLWDKLYYYLQLNQLNRKLIYDENSTWSDWADAVLASADAKNLDAISLFLHNKPKHCSGVCAK